MVKERNLYFDFLRGFAIMMVVGIHTTGDHCGFDSIIAQLNTIFRQILNAGVPIFFAISGFFLSRKDLSSRVNTIKFWKHQIPKVYVPALIWGIPWLALGLYGNDEPMLQLLLWICCGLSVLYFIAVTIQNYLLLPLIKNAPPRKRNWAAVIISFVSISFVTWVRAYKGINLPLIVYAGNFPLWIMFFVMGVSLAQSKRRYNIPVLTVLVILTIIYQFFESRLIEDIGGYGYGIKPSSFIYSALLILLLFSKQFEESFNGNNQFLKFFIWLGKLSFGIYLSHYLIIYAIKMLPYDGLWIVNWVTALLFDLLFILTLKRIIPARFYKYLGL